MDATVLLVMDVKRGIVGRFADDPGYPRRLSGAITAARAAAIPVAYVTISRPAADLDYRFVVLSDGCLGADPEVQRVLTEKVFPRQAAVRTVAEWAAELAPGRGERSQQ
jgi:nicotinamidase-related amidase